MPVPLKAIANTFRMEAEFLKSLLGDKEDRHCLSDLERQTVMYFFGLPKDSKQEGDIYNFVGGGSIAWDFLQSHSLKVKPQEWLHSQVEAFCFHTALEDRGHHEKASQGTRKWSRYQGTKLEAMITRN